ncbi:MAG: flippase [Clostridiaceae bacterium]
MTKQPSLMKNYIYNSIFTALNLLFPIITIHYVSRVIGAEGIGRVNFANSIMNYFLIAASLGIPLYGIREIAKVKENRNRLSRTFSEIFIINFVSTALCSASYYFMITGSAYFKDDIALYLVTGISLFFNIFNLDWFYQGMEEYKYITVRSVSVKLVLIVSLFLFVKDRNDYIIYALINILAVSGNNLINVLSLKKFTRFTTSGLKILKHIKPIMILLSIQVAVNIYINLDTTMCGILADKTSVGYYSNTVKINKIVVMAVTSVSTVLLPRLSVYISNKDYEGFNYLVGKALKVILYISIPAMAGLAFLSDEIINILCGNDFIPAILTMKILVPLVVILGIGNLFGTQVLMTLGQERKLLISVLTGAAVNFSLNLLLIPEFKHDGAAVATVVTEFIVMMTQIIFAYKYLNFKISIRDYKNNLISSCSMVVVLILISQLIKNDIINLILTVSLGIFSYFAVNMLLKDSLTNEVADKLKTLVNKKINK